MDNDETPIDTRPLTNTKESDNLEVFQERCAQGEKIVTRGEFSLTHLMIEESWVDILREVLVSSEFSGIEDFVLKERRVSTIFPPLHLIFSAFYACTFQEVKVVILGQDPYHNDGQAMGLSFSVPSSLKKLPGSLINIFKELRRNIIEETGPSAGVADEQMLSNLSDLDVTKIPGDLTSIAVQGVLFLNTCLTVQAHKAASHSKKAGWEWFTEHVIRKISEEGNGVVFLLWGKHAESHIGMINREKNLVLVTSHPSGLSVNRGFNGCRHFILCNEWLIGNRKQGIDWCSVFRSSFTSTRS